MDLWLKLQFNNFCQGEAVFNQAQIIKAVIGMRLMSEITVKLP
jgi:hypothetical protein